MRCENPQKIFNKYLGQFVLVPCGECRCCRITKALRYAALVRNEIKSHKYNVFFTLTYDNAHVPNIRPSDSHVYRGVQGDEIIGEIPFVLDFLPAKIYQKGVFLDNMSLPFYHDAQLFIKRLRSAINYQLYDSKKAVSELRYCICSEFGTKHFRQHYHGVFHTNSRQEKDWLLKNIPSFWTMCDWDALVRDWRKKYGNNPKHCPLPTECNSKAASYVASYVSSNPCNGIFAKVDEFKPFIKYSKRPIYGLSEFDYKCFRELQDHRRIEGRVWQEVYNDKHELTYELLSLRFLNTFFPKSFYFDKLSYKYQCLLYYSPKRVDAIKIVRYFELVGGVGKLHHIDVEIQESYSCFEDLVSMPVKDGGDSATNHIIKILKLAERVCNLLFGHFTFDDWLWYLDIRVELWTKFDSAMLYLDMLRYRPSQKVDYIFSKYKTFLPSDRPAYVRLEKYLDIGFIDYVEFLFIISNWLCWLSNYDNELNKRLIQDWKDLLLPKHFSSYLTHDLLA